MKKSTLRSAYPADIITETLLEESKISTITDSESLKIIRATRSQTAKEAQKVLDCLNSYDMEQKKSIAEGEKLLAIAKKENCSDQEKFKYRQLFENCLTEAEEYAKKEDDQQEFFKSLLPSVESLPEPVLEERTTTKVAPKLEPCLPNK